MKKQLLVLSLALLACNSGTGGSTGVPETPTPTTGGSTGIQGEGHGGGSDPNWGACDLSCQKDHIVQVELATSSACICAPKPDDAGGCPAGKTLHKEHCMIPCNTEAGKLPCADAVDLCVDGFCYHPLPAVQ
jgi:hypothetical protein